MLQIPADSQPLWPSDGELPTASVSLPPKKVSLYVGDLHPDVTEADLLLKFTAVTHVASVHLCTDRVTHKSLCYAYINFDSISDASKALMALNHTDLKGKTIRIMWYEKDTSRRKSGIGNLFVKNLDPSITSAILHDTFCKYGPVLSCKVAEENGRSKGFGFVQFESENCAISAMDALHGTLLKGKILHVCQYVNKSQKYDAGQELHFTNLYVKNFSADLTEDNLRQMFSKYGKVSSAVIMRDDLGKSKGFGFVSFESPTDAKEAIEALNGAQSGSKNLYVARAQKKAERAEFLRRSKVNMLSSQHDTPRASIEHTGSSNVSLDDKSCKDFFSLHGQVTAANVSHNNDQISTGHGYVNFSSPQMAEAARVSPNGTNALQTTPSMASARSLEDYCRQLQNWVVKPSKNSLPSSNLDLTRPPYHTIHQHLPYLGPFPMSYAGLHKPNTGNSFNEYGAAENPYGACNYQMKCTNAMYGALHQALNENITCTKPMQTAKICAQTKNLRTNKSLQEPSLNFQKKNAKAVEGSSSGVIRNEKQ